jgi:hypothetical protein
VIAAARLRGGSAASARSAASFAAGAVRDAGPAGCAGIVIVRADSAFYSAAFTHACAGLPVIAGALSESGDCPPPSHGTGVVVVYRACPLGAAGVTGRE